MAQVTCVIVDDDVFSTKIMSGYISRTNDVVLAQSFTNAIDAINFLSSHEGKSVNLIFLDIEMPEMNGMEFMRAMDLSRKEVVIYSSQEKYALESYEYDVCDYLLKPVSYARFIRAIGKARCALELREDPNAGADDSTNDTECAFLRDNTGAVHKVKYEDIVLLETMENYVTVTTTRQKILVHIPMKKLVELLPQTYITRIHRSYAVGVKHICNVDKDKVVVELGNERVSLPLSRTYCHDLRKKMSAAAVADSDGILICANNL